MGTEVGIGVGDTVGDTVGDAVGEIVGDCVDSPDTILVKTQTKTTKTNISFFLCQFRCDLDILVYHCNYQSITDSFELNAQITFIDYTLTSIFLSTNSERDERTNI